MGPAEEEQSSGFRDAVTFWHEAGKLVDWIVPPTKILSESAGSWSWFSDGRLNTCFNALDRHIAQGHGDRTAVIWDSAMTGVREELSYKTLKRQVESCAALLADLGVGRGDRVLIFMPMIPEVVVSMLACARIGAIHSVVFGGAQARQRLVCG